ncbi:hypothetical protein ACJVDH_09840 [Pedobacter sp. AW1-32]|uniref:hypothetical protein n=1 Tax=Pedobacter sp. AW1-32 TaxID=3383026 RepID=UPI003FF0F46B
MKEYFKPIQPLRKRKHSYDIGNSFSWYRSHYDKHFLNVVYDTDYREFEALYQYHLKYFRMVNEGSNDAEFYKHVRDLVSDGIIDLLKADKPGSFFNRHGKINERKIKLRAFLDYLNSSSYNDEIFELKEEVISRQLLEIEALNKDLVELKSQLDQTRKLETGDYINISDGHLLKLLDLFQKIQDIKIDSYNELVFSQTQIVWVKMICKYFRHNHKEINFDTVRRYFPANRNDPSRRSASIPRKHSVFQISLSNKRS